MGGYHTEHNSDGLGESPIHGGNQVPSQGNGTGGLQSLPKIMVQNDDLAYHVSDGSVGRESSQWLDGSTTSSRHSWVPVSTAFTNIADSNISFFDINVSDQDPNIREAHVKESDATLIDPQRTSIGHHDADSDTDVNINKAAWRGDGLPELIQSVAPRQPSEKSYITDLGARGREFAPSAGQLEPTTTVVENEEDVNLPLEERLLDILHEIPGHSEKKGFFPEQTLEALINERSVKQQLQRCFKDVLDRDTIEKHTQTICGTTDEGHETSSKKIFAILVLSEKPSAINLFIQEKVTDKDLPFRKVPRRGKSSSRFSLERRSFAVKLLTSRNREEFNHEAEMLMKFSDDSHEHLISLLARYEQFKKFYLIFPWAEADLENYWRIIMTQSDGWLSNAGVSLTVSAKFIDIEVFLAATRSSTQSITKLRLTTKVRL
ncbi:hypothetical protein SLS53_007809 [Cytospora paraplurivora]|uniref:Protein kinase domain-containing protein n=1 Tax=Cytospora paraplurivora TaxID=2898453 RepID=A0AAN9U8C8_9PEZI